MSDQRSIGKDWAKQILAQGYQADNRDPMTTKAKVWDKNKKKMVEITIEIGPDENAKRGYRGYFLDKSPKWRGDLLR